MPRKPRTLRRGTEADAQTAYSARRQQAGVAASGPGKSSEPKSTEPGHLSQVT
jgi:hypothetical protein